SVDKINVRGHINDDDGSSGIYASEAASKSSYSVYDEGEMRSDEESESERDNSSEEGEIQSEVDEPIGEEPISPKVETAWERGLRLARERLKKAKELRAKEKNLEEKRLTLGIPVDPQEPVDVAPKPVYDLFWADYYQLGLIGLTEITCQRILPFDIAPPKAYEVALWLKSTKRKSHRVSSASRVRGRNAKRSSRANSAASSASKSYSSPGSSCSDSLTRSSSLD
ncbi:unnamed protein product, partial [Protopolystoma xenopodis]